ncbi:Inositol hexakisphosphate and diphosphoinositol-pentakisphosphate kinase [Parelaphostrongylus tenuis]|uniref:Inositol hexakisphosphate and diphosphoinositol-pentakisphosphate kinase n=1 Tax=Parelaphostrongylus tenuis TaxID=148309 RepID=A0AAD5N4P0_PARTN|nr:Inositol hexakisphosphate and diphosphoinositol-pentakisphosphate kinase [Parelaphostrongylus tenuis]
MKTLLVLVTIVAMIHGKMYKMEARSSGSLIARLIKTNLYHKYLENLNFRRFQVHKKGSQPIMDYYDTVYTVNATVGTPGQSVALCLDTGSSNLWVIDASCTTDACDGVPGDIHTRRKFNTTASSTFSKETSVTYGITCGDGLCRGKLAKDTVSFADLTIKQQQFLDADDVDGSIGDMPFDGVLGLAWSVLAIENVTTPMQNLLPTLDAPIFTVWFDRKMPEACRCQLDVSAQVFSRQTSLGGLWIRGFYSATVTMLEKAIKSFLDVANDSISSTGG